MIPRKEIELHMSKALLSKKLSNESIVISQNRLILEVLLDIRDILQVGLDVPKEHLEEKAAAPIQ